MTSNAASTPAVTADVPSPRGGASKVADAPVDDAVHPSGSDDRERQAPAGAATGTGHGAGATTAAGTTKAAGATTADAGNAADTGHATTSDPAASGGSAGGGDAAGGPGAASGASAASTSAASSSGSSSSGSSSSGSSSTATASGPDPADLHARMIEARDRLRPEGPTIPAPRSPQGVTVPPAFGGGSAPKADIVAAIDQVIANLATVRAKPDEPAHHALVRLGELTAGEIPDAGWSRTEGLEPDVVAAAADLAQELHTAVAAVLERLDAEQLASSAVVVDRAATSLQVIRMVADLEVFARSRG